MKKRKKQSSTDEVDIIETAYVLRVQQGWSVGKIARHLSAGRRTVQRWLSLYKDPASSYWTGKRSKRVKEATYGEEIDALIKKFKEEVPERSAATIHEIMEDHLGPTCPSVETIRRRLRKMGYSNGKPRDRKGFTRYVREFPNDLWQIDFKGWDWMQGLGKLHLLTIIDDHSRFVLAARWYRTDEEAHVIDLLREAFKNYGLPNEILSDNGSQFRGINENQVTRYEQLLAMLGVKVIHHNPNHPQSKGKIERFFGTIASKFVPEIRYLLSKTLNMSLNEINEIFDKWILKYNTKHKHRSLGWKSPEDVFLNHPRRVLRPLRVDIDWDSWIVRSLTRKVSKQNDISVEGHVFQLPPGHAGLRVRVQRYEDRYEVYSGDTLVDTFYKASLRDEKSGIMTRKVADAGTFKYKRKTYYVGYKNAGKIIKIQEAINGKELLVYDGDDLIARLSKDDGSAY
jgi:transposase InsO family protein